MYLLPSFPLSSTALSVSSCSIIVSVPFRSSFSEENKENEPIWIYLIENNPVTLTCLILLLHFQLLFFGIFSGRKEGEKYKEAKRKKNKRKVWETAPIKVVQKIVT